MKSTSAFLAGLFLVLLVAAGFVWVFDPGLLPPRLGQRPAPGRPDAASHQEASRGGASSAPVRPAADQPRETPASAAGEAAAPVSPASACQVQSGPLAQGALRQSDVRASFQANGHAYQFAPNQLGGFPMVTVEAKAKIPVTIQYREGNPGEPVIVQVEDGGGLAEGKAAQKVILDAQGQANFNFSAGDQPGIYRITLVKANDYKTLNFWVGPGSPAQPQ